MSHHCPHCGEPIVFSHACHLAPDAKPAPAKHAYAHLDASDILKHVETKAEASQPTPCVICGCPDTHEHIICHKGHEAQPTPEPSVGGLLSTSHKILTEQFRWKAENNIRFFDGLGMSPKEKEDFLSSEFAHVYESALIATHAPAPSSAPTVHEVEECAKRIFAALYPALVWDVAYHMRADCMKAAIAACRKDRG